MDLRGLAQHNWMREWIHERMLGWVRDQIGLVCVMHRLVGGPLGVVGYGEQIWSE